MLTQLLDLGFQIGGRTLHSLLELVGLRTQLLVGERGIPFGELVDLVDEGLEPLGLTLVVTAEKGLDC